MAISVHVQEANLLGDTLRTIVTVSLVLLEIIPEELVSMVVIGLEGLLFV